MHDELIHFLSSFNSLSAEEVNAIAALIPVEAFKKGDILLKEGQYCNTCYFVLKGCVRQYILADGEEKTTAFYTEQQAVAAFSNYIQQSPSKHYWVCAEDCLLIIGYLDKEPDMYKQFPKLAAITRNMMEQDLGKQQEEFAAFITSSPLERYRNLLANRPTLLQRVPQHQLASYLGVTAESLSRIRKRVAAMKD